MSVGQVNSITLAYVTPTAHRIYFEPYIYIYIYIKPAKFLEQREEEIRMQHQNAFERKLDGKLEEYVYTSSSLSSAKNLSLFSLSSPLYTLYFWRNSVYPPPIRERTLPSLPSPPPPRSIAFSHLELLFLFLSRFDSRPFVPRSLFGLPALPSSLPTPVLFAWRVIRSEEMSV